MRWFKSLALSATLQGFLALTIVCAFDPASFGQTEGHGPCLAYEPAVVKLTGTLVRKTFPGPPDYKSMRRGDSPEVFWMLKLSQPVCVDQDKHDEFNSAHQGIRSMQLVLDPSAYKKYKQLVGKRVVATGTLFAGHTVHHRTPVLLTVSTLVEAK